LGNQPATQYLRFSFRTRKKKIQEKKIRAEKKNPGKRYQLKVHSERSLLVFWLPLKKERVERLIMEGKLEKANR